MKKNKILMIIPAYNEQENILKVYEDLLSAGIDLDFLFINDASKDNTKKILEDNKLNHINLIHNLGIGGAVQTGYKYACENNYDIAIQFDGDGQHDAKYIKNLIEPIISGKYEFSIGSRFISNLSKFKSTKARRIGIRIISNLIMLTTSKKITDPTSGFRASNRRIIKFFADKYPTEYPEPATIVELIKQGVKIIEVPVNMRERVGGISSITAWKTLYYMINVCLSIIINSFKRGIK